MATLILVLVVFCILRNHSGSPQATYAERKILSVPFIEQGPNLCSEASASMVLLYYGINISQEEINAMGFDRFEKMLPLLDKHVRCEYKSLSVGELVEELKESHPVIIRLKVGFSLHTVVAVGYEDSWIIVHDPASGPCVLLRMEEPFISSWAATGYSSIVVYGRKLSQFYEQLNREFSSPSNQDAPLDHAFLVQPKGFVMPNRPVNLSLAYEAWL